MKEREIKKVVRINYGRAIRERVSCCGPAGGSVCGGGELQGKIARRMGYSCPDLGSVRGLVNQSMGCGNPTAIAALKPGETVVDLGSGGGLDCFLASRKVGRSGKVIGVDMTPEMIDQARENARRGRYRNVEFRLGEIEHLPVPDNSVDVVISNCVVNLAPDKGRVLKEAYRVLKPGGRVAISDLALTGKLPGRIRKSIPAYIGCIGGAILLEDYKKAFIHAGFKAIRQSVNRIWTDIDPQLLKKAKGVFEATDAELAALSKSVVSVYFQARKQRHQGGAREIE